MLGLYYNVHLRDDLNRKLGEATIVAPDNL